MLQNARMTAFIISKLLRENQGGGGRITPLNIMDAKVALLFRPNMYIFPHIFKNVFILML